MKSLTERFARGMPLVVWVAASAFILSPGMVLAGEFDPIASAQAKDRDLTYPITYVVTRQLAGLALLSTIDEDYTLFDGFSLETFKEGFRRRPERDDDEWYWNYMAHPLWGSETFLRARSQNFTFLESFLFSTASSILWEYGLENWATHPSKQDLVITSTAGSVIGEIRFRILKRLMPYETTTARSLRFLFDPLQESTRFLGDRLLGVDWEEPAFEVCPVATSHGLGVRGCFSVRF